VKLEKEEKRKFFLKRRVMWMEIKSKIEKNFFFFLKKGVADGKKIKIKKFF
jgi:hypothetical protein